MAARRGGRPPAEALFLTTQPGWAFATLAELRGLGVQDYVELAHRDSTLVVPATPAVLKERLKTAADVYGLVASGQWKGQWDATRVLAQELRRAPLQPAVWRWLLETRRTGARQYSVGSEVWGETAVHRRDLADAVRAAVHQAFPRWREATSGGVRLLCKADARLAVLGVQRYSALAPGDELPAGRTGALREHLACGLLTLAGVRAGDAVLDPFMGTGTILRAAARRYGAAECIGAEVDREAFREAQARVPGEQAALHHGAFDTLDVAALPERVRLVSNLPFGVQFAQVETARLLRFLRGVLPRAGGVALLMARDQAAEVGEALRLRVKNVLVLGQPAAIVWGGGRAPIIG